MRYYTIKIKFSKDGEEFVYEVVYFSADRDGISFMEIDKRCYSFDYDQLYSVTIGEKT